MLRWRWGGVGWRWQSHVHGQALLKKQKLTWRRCNVTSKMRCRCGFAANPLRNRSFFPVPNLQIMQNFTGEIVEHSGIDPENSHASSKKPCKTHDCQDSNYQKTLFYTDGKQPGGLFMYTNAEHSISYTIDINRLCFLEQKSAVDLQASIYLPWTVQVGRIVLILQRFLHLAGSTNSVNDHSW